MAFRRSDRGRRNPRVHITYEIQGEGRPVQRELPFVVGVLADLSGDRTADRKRLSDRDFALVDHEGLDEFMSRKVKPELKLKVKNVLEEDGGELRVHLAFRSLDDFEPGHIAEQVPPLARLLEIRNKLEGLAAKIGRSGNVEEAVDRALARAGATRPDTQENS
jgi:type VI secretion system protein ImpB